MDNAVMETSRWLDAFFEWQLPLSSVPLGNALLSDLLVATSVLDTPIDEDGDSSYAFVRHPKSLRTNLYVIVDRGHEAFDAAHTHMAAIKAQALHVVSQLPAVIEILRNRREVEEEQQQVGTAATLLRIPLDNIRQAALELGRLSEVTVLGFREPTGIIRELVAALTAESANSEVKEQLDQPLKEEMAEMSDQYKTTLALLESCTQDGGHMKAAVTGLKEYSRHVLQRLQHHWGKAVAALVAMSDVVESVSAACLMDYVEEVEQMGVKSLPLAPTDLQSLLSATVKVHQVFDATENMADLYCSVSDKYVMDSFDKLAPLVAVDPDTKRRPTLLPTQERIMDRITAVDQQDCEMNRQIHQRLVRIENEYISLLSPL